jgi:hypothetical protein
MLDLMTDPQRPLLCVVSPCYNEAAGIRPFYQSLKSVLNSLPDFHHQIIFIDDGSQDTTLQTSTNWRRPTRRCWSIHFPAGLAIRSR